MGLKRSASGNVPTNQKKVKPETMRKIYCRNTKNRKLQKQLFFTSSQKEHPKNCKNFRGFYFDRKLYIWQTLWARLAQ
jgi:hypothetical protein